MTRSRREMRAAPSSPMPRRTLHHPTNVCLCLLAAALMAACGNSNAVSNGTPDGKTRGVTPLTHEAMFPIASGTHANLACSTCHGDGDTFTQINCTNCHTHSRSLTDPFHVGVVNGYAWGPTTCLNCHPRGEALAFDHSQFFPISAGTVHANVACNDCHTDLTDRTKFDCTGCHAQGPTASPASNMDQRHAVVSAYVWDSPHCYSCHKDASVPTNGINHAQFFPIDPGTFHQGISCGTCHTKPGDRSVFTCTGSCHVKSEMDPRHSDAQGYQYQDSSCYGCHQSSQVPFDHSAYFPTAAGTTHDQTKQACNSCHPDALSRTNFDCTNGCHTQTDTVPRHTGVPNFSYGKQTCYQCHPKSDVVGLIDHSAFFPIASGQTHDPNALKITCETCHTDPNNRQNVTCTGACHPSTTTPGLHTQVGGFAYASTSCLKCHADSQVDTVASHMPFGITSAYKHYLDSCFSCHPQMRTDKPFGTDFVISKVDCLSCHPQATMASVHAAVSGYSYNTQTCLQAGCHQNGFKP